MSQHINWGGNEGRKREKEIERRRKKGMGGKKGRDHNVLKCSKQTKNFKERTCLENSTLLNTQNNLQWKCKMLGTKLSISTANQS